LGRVGPFASKGALLLLFEELKDCFFVLEAVVGKRNLFRLELAELAALLEFQFVALELVLEAVVGGDD
jgi:hypothetical protein